MSGWGALFYSDCMLLWWPLYSCCACSPWRRGDASEAPLLLPRSLARSLCVGRDDDPDPSIQHCTASPVPDPPPPQINEILRKGAEDTQSVIKQAGAAVAAAAHAAAEMHKKYAPKPADKPAEVNPALRDK